MGERRAGLRVAVSGVAMWRRDDGHTVRGVVENVSPTGALLAFLLDDIPDVIDLELSLGSMRGRASARAVRREGRHVAISFESLEPAMQSVLDRLAAAASRRPIIVMDDDARRRRSLVAALRQEGMTPLAPRTPLDAIDLLTNPQLPVSVALLAPSFGHSVAELSSLVADSFPWVRAVEITDDLVETARRALHAAPACA